MHRTRFTHDFRSVPALLLASALAAPALALDEDFDEPGTSFADTIFPDLHTPTGAGFSRDDLTGVASAPSTAPPLPINQAGDKEGVYAGSFATTPGFALMADTPENDLPNALIEGYVDLSVTSLLGQKKVGFVLRASAAPVEAYGVTMNASPSGPTATLQIAYISGGAVATVLATSDPFPVDFPNENYRLLFIADGTDLNAKLYRRYEVAGTIVEDPVDLHADPGIQSILFASDTTLTSGRPGLMAKCRGTNKAWWDEVKPGTTEIENPPAGACVTFEPEPLGTNYGSSVGHAPGDVIFTENGIEVSIDEYTWCSSATTFGYMRIASSAYGFGDGHAAELGNASLHFNFAGFSGASQVTFEWMEQAPHECINLEVNGHAYYVDSRFMDRHGTTVAPGVTLYATEIGFPVAPGIHRFRGWGQLVGPVTSLRIGGSELFLDNICIDVPAPASCTSDLDGNGIVEFADILVLLAHWGNPGGLGDLNGDNSVDFADLLVLISDWGPCP
ncbi:MAG: hypothetical protein ACYTGP_01565 [Planctomycetota bacterium]|jgi:hypothetical protein